MTRLGTRLNLPPSGLGLNNVLIQFQVLLFRTLLLATADTEGLPGHASGCLQAFYSIIYIIAYK